MARGWTHETTEPVSVKSDVIPREAHPKLLKTPEDKQPPLAELDQLMNAGPATQRRQILEESRLVHAVLT